MKDKALISIVDDDRPFRESMRRLMRSVGYGADDYPSATDFLASARLSDTSCLIADVNMPEMTGPELFRRLVKLERSIPTILVTAYPSEPDRVQALRDGVVCYLRKPVEEHILLQCLRAALTSDDSPKAAS